MMAAFNVSALADFGYPETTRFIDPMEERWRSRPITTQDDSYQALYDKCALFESLEAYNDVGKLEDAIDDYYKNGPKSYSTLQTVVASSASAASSMASLTAAVTSVTSAGAAKSSSSMITSAPRATSTKSEDKRTTTTSTRRR
jgi:bilirubin oxidase